MTNPTTAIITIANENKEVAAIQRLEELEAVIERGQKTFYEVGQSLAEIRDNELYKVSKGGDFKTFEEYCKKRWDFGRDYAYKLIAAKSVVDNVYTCIQKPSCEGQARHLARLEDPEQQTECWQRAIDTALNGVVTAKHVKDIVDEMTGKTRTRRHAVPPPKARSQTDRKGHGPRRVRARQVLQIRYRGGQISTGTASGGATFPIFFEIFRPTFCVMGYVYGIMRDLPGRIFSAGRTRIQ